MQTASFPRLALGLLLTLMAPTLSTSAAETTRLRATVDAVTGDQVTVTTRDGRKGTLQTTPETRYSSIVPSDLSAIRDGTFIGTAAVEGEGGKLRALEVVVFPEAMRGTGEGHYPWDLEPDSTMTNATVQSMVGGVQGRDLKLSYKGGEKTVTVPEGVPIVTIEPGTAALLQPGAHIFAVAQPAESGGFRAVFIGVGKDGLVPPM